MSRIGTRKQNGMTITELLIVVALIGIVAMMAIPNFNAMMKSYQASTAVSEMIAMLHLGRQMAVSRRESYVFITFTTGNWQLMDLSPATLKSATLPDHMTVTAQAAFTFDANGSCTNPTTYAGTTPSTQFIRVDAQITPGRIDRYTLEMSPVGRVKSSKEIIE